MELLKGSIDEIKKILLNSVSPDSGGRVVAKNLFRGHVLKNDDFDSLVEQDFLQKYSDNYYFFALPGRESLFEQNLQFEAAIECKLPLKDIVISGTSAMKLQDISEERFPEQLEFEKRSGANIENTAMSELFRITDLKPDSDAGIETKQFSGIDFKIKTKERLLLESCNIASESFYKAIKFFSRQMPSNYDFSIIRELGRDLELTNEATIVIACLLTAREMRNIF